MDLYLLIQTAAGEAARWWHHTKWWERQTDPESVRERQKWCHIAHFCWNFKGIYWTWCRMFVQDLGFVREVKADWSVCLQRPWTVPCIDTWWRTRRPGRSTRPSVCCRFPAASPSTAWTPWPSSEAWSPSWGNLSPTETRTSRISSRATSSPSPKQVSALSAARVDVAVSNKGAAVAVNVSTFEL